MLGEIGKAKRCCGLGCNSGLTAPRRGDVYFRLGAAMLQDGPPVMPSAPLRQPHLGAPATRSGRCSPRRWLSRGRFIAAYAATLEARERPAPAPKPWRPVSQSVSRHARARPSARSSS